jgi:hypothetical protein
MNVNINKAYIFTNNAFRSPIYISILPFLLQLPNNLRNSWLLSFRPDLQREQTFRSCHGNILSQAYKLRLEALFVIIVVTLQRGKWAYSRLGYTSAGI